MNICYLINLIGLRGYIASLLHVVEIRLKKSNDIFFGFLNTPNVGC